MASRFVLDTHALVWYLEGSARLSSAAKAVMDDTKGEMILVLVIACIQNLEEPASRLLLNQRSFFARYYPE